jgi:sialate O-acetylesterase
MHLSRLFTPGMVLQHGSPIPIWGWSAAQARISVSLGGRTVETVATAQGRWLVTIPRLPPTPPGQALVLEVDDHRQPPLRIEDVRIGDVWLCVGHQGSGRPAPAASRDRRASAAEAAPALRSFCVERSSSPSPLDEVPGGSVWQEGLGDGVPTIAADFAERHARAHGIPVGLLCATWSPTRFEAWISKAALAADPRLRPILDACDLLGKLPDAQSPTYQRQLQQWQTRSQLKDPGPRGLRLGFAKPGQDLSEWTAVGGSTSVHAPGQPRSGSYWLRREVHLPATWRSRELEVHLGSIDGTITHLLANGEAVDLSPEGDDGGPTAILPRALTRDATVVLALRLLVRATQSGLPVAGAPFVQPVASRAKPQLLPIASWLHRLESAIASRSAEAPRPRHAGDPELASTIAQAMLMPLVPYALRGAIWQSPQEEPCSQAPAEALQRALVRDLRTAWGQPRFAVAIIAPTAADPAGAPSAATGSSDGEADTITIPLGHAAAIPTAPATGASRALRAGRAADTPQEQAAAALEAWAASLSQSAPARPAASSAPGHAPTASSRPRRG